MKKREKYIRHEGTTALAAPGKKARRKKWKIFMEIYVLSALVMLILLFFLTGLGKISNHSAFITQLSKQPLPTWSTPVLGYVLPVSELGTVTLMCIPKLRFWGLGLAVLLMATYTLYAYLAFIEIYGYVPCACGKVFEKLSWKQHFIFNLAITLLGASALIIEYKLERRLKNYV